MKIKRSGYSPDVVHDLDEPDKAIQRLLGVRSLYPDYLVGWRKLRTEAINTRKKKKKQEKFLVYF